MGKIGSRRYTDKHINISWFFPLVFAACLTALLVVTSLAQGNLMGTVSIEYFEADDPVYTATVDPGTAFEDLALPDFLRAVVALSDDELAASFEQADPDEDLGDVAELFGYEAPSDAEELREAGEKVVYTVGLDEPETSAPGYRVYGSLGGGDNAWYACDENGSLTGKIVDVSVTWDGDYDPDEPGTYILTSSFTGYTYASEYPYAVITIGDESTEENASSQEQSALSSSGISTLAATSGTIYVNEDGTGDGTVSTDPAALNQDLLDGLTAAATLVVVDDIQLSEGLTIPAGIDVTIVDDGTARTISVSGLTGKIITVESTASLTIETSSSDDDSLLTFQGGSSSSKTHGFFVNGALNIHGGTVTGFEMSSARSTCILVVNGTFEMTGGLITDNRVGNQYSGIVVINGNSDATISGGIISNNEIGYTNAATVYVLAGMYSSLDDYEYGNPTLTMTGGTISDNTVTHSTLTNMSFTAGVLVGNANYGYNGYLYEATFTMKGGTITNNTGAAAGGGVYVCGAGNFYMEDGEISYNTAAIGGGVATYDMYVYVVGSIFGHTDAGYSNAAAAGYSLDDWADSYHMPATFEMTGGIITGNTASYTGEDLTDGGCGGGIYIASNRVVISAGYITDNIAGSQGGGVYVGSIPYELQMYNTLVTNNTATVLGGGLWFCPTGDASLYVTNGAAIFGNIADSDGDGISTDDTDAAADDFVSVTTEGNTHYVTLADRMLGGGEVEWYKDGGVLMADSDNSLGVPDGSDRYDPENPTERITGIVDISDGVAYKAVVSDNAAELAESFATVYVTGNYSQRGGGIGSNGSIVIGVADDEWTLEVTKDWGEIAEEYWQPVTIRLVIGDYELDAVELNEENNWTATFTQLPNPDTLGELEITVIEEGSSYTASYTELVRDDDNYLLSITISNELRVIDSVISGLVWLDADGDGIQDSDEMDDDTFDGMVVSLWRYNEETGEYEAVLGSSTDGTSVVGEQLAVTVRHGTGDESTEYVVLIDGVYYVATVVTTADGGFEFRGMPAGTYRLFFEAEDIAMGAFKGTLKNEGDDTTVDSDADFNYIDMDGNTYDEGDDYNQWLDTAYIEDIVLAEPADGGEGSTMESRNNDAGFVPRTGSITVVKTDESGERLNGVTFTLELLLSGSVEDGDAVWDSDNAQSGVTATYEYDVDDSRDGVVVFENLEPGTYRLTETATTGDNALLADAIYITIPYAYEDSDEADFDAPSYMFDGMSYVLDLGCNVQDGKIFSLPLAGGTSDTGYIVAGAACILGSGTLLGILYWSKYRKERIKKLLRYIKLS